jgi:hypothetical protein
MSKDKFKGADIGGLLGTITEKRQSGQLKSAPIQRIQPVGDDLELKSKNGKTEERKNGGRPSAKKDSIEYVKVSPRIPKFLKKRVDMALIEERFIDPDGERIKTLDELVAFALEELLNRPVK